MPRISPLRQLNRDDLTPFAQIIYDYLVGHYMLVSELAEASGVSNNAIWSWLKHGIVPRRQSIVQLAERVRLDDDAPAFDLDELLTAAGLPTTAQMQRERGAYLDMLNASVDEVLAIINADRQYTPEYRAIIERKLRQLPEQFMTATNTWREFHHASPLHWQMEQSEEHAAVFDAAPIESPEEAHGQPRRRHDRHDTRTNEHRNEHTRHTTDG